MVNIGYLSDFPFWSAFGGKEIQLMSYYKYINKLYKDSFRIKLVDHWNKDELSGLNILHFFGYGHFYHIIKSLRANEKKVKIVLSPTYYCNDWRHNKYAFLICSLFPFPNYYKNFRFEIENSDLIIVNSNSEKEIILANISSNVKIKVVYNAIDDDFMEIRDESKDIFLKKFGLKRYSYILSVGMLDERKNSILMLKAFVDVYKKLNKKLVIIGSPRFKEKNNYELFYSLLQAHSDKILHIPYIDKEKEIDLLKSAYFNCAFHYLPSHIETPGISNLEAMSYGKNILVGKCPPVMEYFGNNAIYCDSSDIESIKNSLLMCNEKPYYNEQNFRLVKNSFTYSRILGNLLDAYKKVLNIN